MGCGCQENHEKDQKGHQPHFDPFLTCETTRSRQRATFSDVEGKDDERGGREGEKEGGKEGMKKPLSRAPHAHVLALTFEIIGKISI